MSKFRWILAAAFAVVLAPSPSLAQEAARITGRVTDETGAPVSAASVVVRELNIGTVVRADGTYMLLVPAARIRAGQEVELSAQSIGYTSARVGVTLEPGATVTQNFQLGRDVLELEGIVATGLGTTTTRERLASTVNTVKSEDIQRSRETNIVAALAGKAPNVQVTSSSGEPGAGAYIQIRGAASVVGGTQPLFVVDGVEIDNSSTRIEGSHAGTQVTNRAADINPNDIERVEILKGAAATAIYGTRGANGVVIVTTKSGQPGATRATYSINYSVDDVTRTVPLQRTFGQGLDLSPLGDDQVILRTGPFTWGSTIPEGTPVYDHANEVYQTGHRLENNVTLSGGSEATTWYLSVGRMDHEGVIMGNSEYDRTTVRLKGAHGLRDNLRVGGNIAYTDGNGDFVQQGSNISGIQLGALRTPPDFNNKPYIDPETGLHRSYRTPNPTRLVQGRGYDNPFWVAFEMPNEAEVGRVFGNVDVDYRPVSWLNVNWLLGADYGSDERLTIIPKSSSDFPQGRIIRGNIVNAIYSHTLRATAAGQLTDAISGSLTLGQNLKQRDLRENIVRGTNLIFGTEETDFAVDVVGDEFKYTIRSDGYFGTTEVNFADQLTLNGTLRLDGSSTFGGEGKRFLYPGVGASWVFTNTLGDGRLGFLDFGKLRASYGISGREPPVFSNVSAFQTGTFGDGWINGIESIYLGQEGVFSEAVLGNDAIRPEKKEEFEVGTDLAFFDQRFALGVTYYDRQTTDAILLQPTPPSTGFSSQWANAAEIENYGWEVTADVTPIRTPNINWTIGAQYGRNVSCVTELAGAEDVYLGGFTGSTVSLVQPDPETGQCHPFGVFFGDDFVRFGRGNIINGQNIDEAFPGWSPGDLYINEDGFPEMDDRYRILGDPNPDWTGSVRSSVTLFNNLRVSGLLDIKAGGDMWNGTRGALYFFGTHAFTEDYHGVGKDTIFPGFGPGAGEQVKLNWATWTLGGIGSGFTGPSSQFIEDAGFVKLRDISVAYTFEQPWLERFGFNTMDITVSGRNLKTWTDYTGIDPESNLWGQSVARGIDYFNNPQTRSVVFSVNLNR